MLGLIVLPSAVLAFMPGVSANARGFQSRESSQLPERVTKLIDALRSDERKESAADTLIRDGEFSRASALVNSSYSDLITTTADCGNEGFDAHPREWLGAAAC